jgi:hypothetical protein
MEKPDLFNRPVLGFTDEPVPETLMPLRRQADQ